jgi:hypothetical protein
MCDVRKTAVRVMLMGLAAGLLAGALSPASAQTVSKKRQQQPQRARRETNASRRARIQRTIADTYSHKWEVAGGGGYMRFRSGSQLKKNNEVSWAMSVDRYLTPKLAIVGAAQGSFGNAHALQDNTFGVYNPQINEYFFMGGANYRFYRKEKFAVGGQALAGVGWGIFSGGAKGLEGTQVGVWQDGFRPAFSLGVNMDYNFYPNLAFRFTPQWIGTTFQSGQNAPSSSLQNNAGFNMGVVYRFGRQ